MFQVSDRVVYGMAALRAMSGFVEMAGAIAMLYFGTADRALQVNAVLALVGPLVLVTVTLLGVIGIAQEVHSLTRVVWIVMGVGLILYGSRG